MVAMIVILNGPPGCGKDTIANAYLEKYPSTVLVSFKVPIQRILAALMGCSTEQLLDIYEDRVWKESPNSMLGGMSPRETLIWLSEEVIKPKFGKPFFGRVLASQINGNSNYLSTDGGFAEEIYPLLVKCHELRMPLKIVHVYREGCSFQGDSRNYITTFPEYVTELYNNGTVEEAVEKLSRAYQP